MKRVKASSHKNHSSTSIVIMTTSTRPPIPSNMMLQRRDSAKQFAEENWNRAATVLSARPSLMTSNVLLLVLKSRPPPHVIQFMLELNPRAADIPEQGPSPLQVAVRHYASVEVCSLLIQACPLALMATHSGYDPLMYAKIWRREEPELLSLLSRPLSYWLEQEKSRMLLAGQAVSSKSLPISPSPRKQMPPKSASSRNLHTTSMNDEEMHNIKTIAATIVRAQKKQVANLNQYRQQVDQSIQEEPLCSWPEPPASIRTTTRVVRIPYSSGKPLLCPKKPQQQQCITSSGQPSHKRSADGDLLEDQRPSKRVKRAAEQETLVPLPTVVVLLSDDDDGSLKDDDGDFYFMTTQDNCTPLASVETEDCASLAYSECDDLEDDILDGIDIDLDELSDEVGVASFGHSQLESFSSLVGLDEMVMVCLVASTWTSLATSLGVAPPLNVVVPSGTVLTASEVSLLRIHLP